MEYKFKLNNVLLYIKGFYKYNTVNNKIDIINDLIEMLRLDGYMPINKMDVYSVVMREFSDCMKDDFDLYSFMNMIGTYQEETNDDFVVSSLFAIYYTLRYDSDVVPQELPIYDKNIDVYYQTINV